MKIYLAGICGAFMAGLARLAQEVGYEVGGCDSAAWPPMSNQLAQAGIAINEGWDSRFLDRGWDCIIIGNALSRGNPLVEEVLRRRLPFMSGAQWLSEQILSNRKVAAVAGTHGKTTTTSMLAWILECNGLQPGFLIGGEAKNFAASASIGRADAPFVIEADEYDTAFFDKRPKFMHYRPDVLVLGNLEFDHADIYATLEDMQQQFHYLLRLVPADGKVVYRGSDAALREVLQRGVWSNCETFAIADETADGTADGTNAEAADWTAQMQAGRIKICYGKESITRENWRIKGRHNLANAVAAIAAASELGASPQSAVRALQEFKGVARRLEIKFEAAGVKVYDDFAHHPTAIKATLETVRSQLKARERLLAVFEPRSNSMQMGVHCDNLAAAFEDADKVFLYCPSDLKWDPAPIFENKDATHCFADIDEMLSDICAQAQFGDHIVVMSNGAFGGLPDKIGQNLKATR